MTYPAVSLKASQQCTSVANVIKPLFSAILKIRGSKLQRLSLASPNSLVCWSIAKWSSHGILLDSRLITTPTNNRLGHKDLPGTLFVRSIIDVENVLITLTPGPML